MIARLSDALRGTGERRERAGLADGALAGYADRSLHLAAPFLLVAAVAGSDGGYFPRTWGWIALPLAWAAVMALIVRRRVLVSGLELAYLGGLAAFVVWVGMSLFWTANVDGTALEIQRDLVYPLAIAAGILVLRPRDIEASLAAVVAAIGLIALYALGTRLFPDRIGVFRAEDPVFVYRLGDPVGYWNALGIFCVLALLPALGFAARARHVAGRALAGGGLPILVATIYFTYGRGVWIALGIGLLGAIALDPRRVGLCVFLLLLAPVPVVTVWLASRSAGLTERGVSLGDAARDGKRFALLVVLLVFTSAAVATVVGIADRRIEVGRRLRRGVAVALACALAGLLVAVFVAYGAPHTMARKAYDAFASPPVGVKAGQSFNKRLFQLSSNGRVDEWRAAWDNYRKHQALGSGAGTFEQYWLEHRPHDLRVRDAHSLYLEVLSELGPIGLVILLAALLVPLVGGMRIRRRPLFPLVSGAYLAFLVHAGVDWDWEVVAVTMTALLIGLTMLVARRDEDSRRNVGVRFRVGAGVVLAAAAVFSAIGLLGNIPRERAAEAAESLRWTTAVREANKAIRWTPWAAGPWQLRGRGERGLRRYDEARRSFMRALDESPRDWRIWFDLGTVSSGRAATCAYVEAARLNPLERDILVLREKGLLPKDQQADRALGC